MTRAQAYAQGYVLALLAVIAGLAALALEVHLRSAPSFSGYARVIDGDTIDVDGRRVRLAGIDAPEIEQTCTRLHEEWPCGLEAKKALAVMIGDSEVYCEYRGTDRYNRTLARCFISIPRWRADLAREMVRMGMALAYRRYSTEYADTEDAAVAAKIGMWAGKFEPPWTWRRDHHLHSERQPGSPGQ